MFDKLQLDDSFIVGREDEATKLKFAERSVEIHSSQQVLEARVRPEVIEGGIDFDKS